MSPEVGQEPFEVEVTAGHIQIFARAVGDTSRLYLDPAAAATAGFPDVIAPPTFLVVADHFDPRFERRPRPGQPWLGSGGSPSGTGDDEVPPAPLHVGQQFDYHRAVVAGEALTARRLAPVRWTRTGRRGGRLDFVELITEFVDPAGAPVARVSWLDVYTERSHAALSTDQAQPADRLPSDEAPATTTTLVEDLTRTQLVMYAGAAGDFHPLHHDDVYARHRGYPGVFAPGMLTMALAVRPVVAEVGAGHLLRYSGRWAAQVWPGDSLIATTNTSDAVHDGDAVVKIEVTVRNQHHDIVFTGRALARPASEGSRSAARAQKAFGSACTSAGTGWL